MRRPVALFLAGLLTALCFVGPLAGLASSLSWPAGPLGAKETAARRILYGEYSRHLERGDLPPRTYEPTTDCEIRLWNAAMPQSPGAESVMTLRSALIARQAFLRNAIEETIDINALASLPTPFLGALEGCLGRSLLSPFCSSYVRRRTARAEAQAAHDSQSRFAQVNREMRGVWCAAADGVPPEPKPAPSKAAH